MSLLEDRLVRILELRKLGRNEEEIALALDKPIELVETALNYRKKIEPKLTKALQILFPDERINKPYR